MLSEFPGKLRHFKHQAVLYNCVYCYISNYVGATEAVIKICSVIFFETQFTNIYKINGTLSHMILYNVLIQVLSLTTSIKFSLTI